MRFKYKRQIGELYVKYKEDFYVTQKRFEKATQRDNQTYAQELQEELAVVQKILPVLEYIRNLSAPAWDKKEPDTSLSKEEKIAAIQMIIQARANLLQCMRGSFDRRITPDMSEEVKVVIRGAKEGMKDIAKQIEAMDWYMSLVKEEGI